MYPKIAQDFSIVISMISSDNGIACNPLRIPISTLVDSLIISFNGINFAIIANPRIHVYNASLSP